MELLGFLLSVLAIAFVIAKVIFSTNAKSLDSTELPTHEGDDDS